MKTPARVAVVMATHEAYTQKYLAEFYKSFSAQTYPRDFATLFLVDNGSTDHSLRLLNSIVGARVLANEKNLGWGAANNRAIRVALQEGFDYVVLLNMDTLLDENWLAYLVAEASNNPDVHIFQSKILLSGTDRINSLGNKIHYLGYGYCIGYGQKDPGPLRRMPMDFASGAAMLVKREVFEKVGLFREDYFMYYDDVEFCWRARLAGFHVGLAEKSICYHKYEFSHMRKFLYYLERNRLLTLLTLERLGTILAVLPVLLASETLMSIYFLCEGSGATRWRVLRYFFNRATWRAIAARRREITVLRVRKDKDVVGNFAGTIVFAEIKSPAVRYFANPILWAYWAVVRRLIFW